MTWSSRFVCIAVIHAAGVLPSPAQLASDWNRSYVLEGNHGATPVGMAVDETGNIFYAPRVPAADRKPGNYSISLVKHSAVGSRQWEKEWDKSPDDHDSAAALVTGPGGSILMAANSNAPPPVWSRTTIVKFDGGDGSVLWESPLNDGENCRTVAMAADPAGNVYVTGVIYPGGSGDWFTVKLASDGSELWQTRYDGAAHADDAPAAIAVDASGHVSVSGTSTGSGAAVSSMSVRYDGATGTQLWAKPGAASSVRSAAVDPAGNLIVLGTASTLETGTDSILEKLSAADGAVLWTHRSFDGSDYYSDRGNAMVLDETGNVYVTGVRGSWETEDMITAKYAAADGTELWQSRYAGPDQREDHGWGIALDGSGGVFVTGATRTADLWYEMLTVQYDRGDGRQLSLRRRGAEDYDAGYSIAVSPAGGRVFVLGEASSASFVREVVLECYKMAPLEAWQQDYFGDNLLAPSARLTADPDRDGQSNLMEWACGFNPLVSNPPPGRPVLSPVGELLVHFPLNAAAAADGVTYTVEWSDSPDAHTWTTDGVARTVTSGDGTLQQILAVIPPGGPSRFARLRVGR